MLYRAAETAQALFLIYREIALDKLIVKAERTEGQLRLFEGTYQNEIFLPFPKHLIKDENEKKAGLTYLACGDAYGYMDMLIKNMIGGIISKLSEMSIKLNAKHPLKLRMFDALKEDRYEYQHEALLVTLQDGSSFVVDIAGSQYGHNVPVMPHDTYLKTMARDKSSPIQQPFGYQRNQMLIGCNPQVLLDPRLLDPRYHSANIIRKANEHLYQAFNRFLATWQKNNMPLSAMLKLKEKDYLDNQKNLRTAADKILLNARSQIKVVPNDSLESPGPTTFPDLKSKERTFDEQIAELVRSASANGHEVYSIR
ncbi:MAG: hypothetical protein Q9226_003768 [Calogaya cf. arnoldii]